MVRAQRLAGGLVLLLATAVSPAAAADAEHLAAADPANAPTMLASASPAAAEGAPQTAPRPAPKPRPRLSTAIANQISSSLPIWKKPPPGAKERAPTPPPSSDVVRMAPVIVGAYRIPGTADKEWRSPQGRDALLMERYLSPLDRNLLNRYTLPLIGVSNEARARMMYEEDKRLEDLKWVNDQIDDIQRVDPQAAKDLQQIRDSTFTRTEP